MQNNYEKITSNIYLVYNIKLNNSLIKNLTKNDVINIENTIKIHNLKISITDIKLLYYLYDDRDKQFIDISNIINKKNNYIYKLRHKNFNVNDLLNDILLGYEPMDID